MSPEEEALDRTVRSLERLGIPYMVTGSLATSYHGRPRATHDADVIIDPSPDGLDDLVRDLDAAGFYVDAAGARVALRHRRQFNIVEVESACKIDLIICKDRPFSREELRRRLPVGSGLGRPIAMVTPEDAILSKLEWARKAGDSERQLRDAAGVLEITSTLDRAYIEHWAAQLGILDLWRQLSAE